VLITVALEEKAANRELASVLLSDLFGHVINYRDVVMGFDIILSQLSELSLDTPDAPHIVGNFIARCVADDCLPPVYITNHTEVTDPKMM
jgi:programmed cell death protein 4